MLESLSVIIPCYNEKETIEEIVNRVRESQIENLEIIVVDNDSTDGTREILKDKIEKIVDKVIYNEKNIGKGGSVRRGFASATNDIVIVQDADLEYDPKENYKKMIAPILEGKADVVYGNRFADAKGEKGRWINYLGNRLFTFLSNRITGLRLQDMETCYKAIKREVIQSIELKENGFGFEPEVTAKLAAKKVRIIEVPITYHPRKSDEGKKVKFSDGLKTIWCIFKYRHG